MKKVLSIFMALALLCTLLPTAAFAAQKDEEDTLETTYTYSNNGYTLEKVSHADVATGEEDGLVDYYECYDADGNVHNGVIEHQEYTDEDWAAFAKTYGYTDDEIAQIKDSLVGDGCQSYCYSAIGYGDNVYIGTMYGGIGIQKSSAMAGLSAMGLLTDDAQYNSDLADAVMNALYGDHYYVEHVKATEGILVKINVKTGESKILMAGSVNGMEPTLRGACEYNGKLYFVGAILQEGEGEGKGDPISGDTSGAGSSGMPSIYEIDPEEDTVKLVYQATDAEGYAEMVKKQVFPTLRTIINYKGTLVASVTDENGAHFIAYTPTEADYDENGVFQGISVPEGDDGAIRNSNFHVIADQETELFDYPAYLTSDSNYGGTVYQVIEYNGDLYAAINCGRSTLGTADEVVYNEETGEYESTGESSGCYRGWAIVKGELIDPNGAINDKTNWKWTPIVGNTDDDQWEGSDGAMYTFNIDPERYAPATCTLEVYNGYLYIGDYDDVTLATFTALYTMNFHHLATNLQQSINLYRLDEDMNVELVVGDATDMFPDGSMTGLGAGYGHHTNQYTAKATVWDPDDSDDNDGILFYSTLDEATILRPLCELTNGDLMELSSDQWKEKVDYIRTLLQLVINNKLSSDDDVDAEIADEIDAVDADFNNIDDAKAFIAKLIEQASNMVENDPTMFADDENVQLLENADISAEPYADIELSNTQIGQISRDLMAGNLNTRAARFDGQDISDIAAIEYNLTAMTELVEKNNIDEFYQLYLKTVDLYEGMKGNLPEAITEKLDSVLNDTTAGQMRDLLTCLTYMQDSVIGCDCYAITTESDGSDLELTEVTANGLGDSNNHTMRNFATTDDYLLMCTGNPVKGAQVWRLTDWPGKDSEDEDEDEPEPEPEEHVHQFTKIVHEPTCTHNGYTNYVCRTCNYTYASYWTAPLGHDWDEGTVTVQPGCLTEGVLTYTCTRCGETKTEAIAATGSPFDDVQDSGKYYYEPVLWAVDMGIANGINATTFAPLSTCTRAQVVAFLYRAAGEPKVSGTNPFTDVKEGSYYYNAVLWGYQNGVVKGTSATTFSPNDTITRAQFIAFLYRYAGEPAVTDQTNPFVDVPAGKYYTNAVLWGYQNGVVNGTDDTHFGPNDGCTRGQVMTFLWRYMAK